MRRSRTAARPAGGLTRFAFEGSVTKLDVGVAIEGKSRKTLAAMVLGRACFTQFRKAGVSTVITADRAPDCRSPS